MLRTLWRECRRIAWAWWRVDRLRVSSRDVLFEEDVEILAEMDRI